MVDIIYILNHIKILLIPKLKQYDIVKCAIFGYYARGEATKISDIDILFETYSSMILEKWRNFKSEISNELQKNIDLVEYGSFSPRVFNEIQKELVVIYEEKRWVE